MKSLKVGDSVLRVKVVIDVNMSVCKVNEENLTVIGVSDHFYCLNDDLFEKVARTKTFEFGYGMLDKVIIMENKSKLDVDLFGKFNIKVISTSSKKVTENRINKEFNKWLTEKIGAYGLAKTVTIKLS